jgi:5-methyltetrahydrofolate--homocysteine methyltransferase
MFVATAGLGVESLVESFRIQGEEYQALLISMIADRLAEAFSEYLEDRLSSSWWKLGDATVIRPAIGYPSAPDHIQKKQVFSLLEATERIGVELTEGFAMKPAASVCGFYFAGEGSSYFSLGAIGKDQLSEYAGKTGRTVEELEQTMRIDAEQG